MAKRTGRTWAEVGIRNGGFRATIRGLRFAMGWGLATAELGREPESIDEYAETMELTRRTAFRDQAAFREAFPTETTPARMNEMAGVQAKYNATWRRLRDLGAAEREVEPLTFLVGSATADV